MKIITNVKPRGTATAIKATNLTAVMTKLRIYATSDTYSHPEKRTLKGGMPMGLLLALTYPTDTVINVYS